jgi:hypothetical protein
MIFAFHLSSAKTQWLPIFLHSKYVSVALSESIKFTFYSYIRQLTVLFILRVL